MSKRNFSFSCRFGFVSAELLVGRVPHSTKIRSNVKAVLKVLGSPSSSLALLVVLVLCIRCCRLSAARRLKRSELVPRKQTIFATCFLKTLNSQYCATRKVSEGPSSSVSLSNVYVT